MSALRVGDRVDGTEHDLDPKGREWAQECRDRGDADGPSCTRLVGHDGQHEAAGLTHIQAVWS